MKLPFPLLLLFLCYNLLNAKTDFYAARQAEGVQLQWQPRSWNGDQIGYQIRRRAVNTGASPWITIGPEIIQPAVRLDRDYSVLGLSQEQSSHLLENLRERNLDEAQTVPEETMASFLAKANGLQIGDAIRLSEVPDIAYAWGLGYFDATAKGDANYEYALHIVSRGKKVLPNAEASARPLSDEERLNWADAAKLEYRAIFSDEWVWLEWRMALEAAKQMGLLNFKIEQKINNETGWTVLETRTPYFVGPKNDARWKVLDSRARKDKATSASYRLVPFDVFQHPLTAYEINLSSLDQERPDPKKYGPNITEALVKNDMLIIKWTQPSEIWNFNKLTGFRLVTIRKSKTTPLPPIPLTERSVGIPVSKLDPEGKYSLEAVYMDWDDYNSAVSSNKLVFLDPRAKNGVDLQ